MRRDTPATVLVVLVLALATVFSSDFANAYWSGFGSGSVVGATGTALALTLGPGNPATDLYPGGQTAVVLIVSNPNVFAVHIGSLALDTSQGGGGYGVDVGHSGCAVAAFTFMAPVSSGIGWTVPAKVGTVDGTLSATLVSALAMSVDAADACQGAMATVYLKASL